MTEDDKLAHVQTPNFAQVQAYQERPRDSCVSERSRPVLAYLHNPKAVDREAHKHKMVF